MRKRNTKFGFHIIPTVLLSICVPALMIYIVQKKWSLKKATITQKKGKKKNKKKKESETYSSSKLIQ